MRVAVDAYFKNTAQTAVYSDTTNRLLVYEITPDEGYVLHDKELDVYIEDEFGNVLEDTKGYTPITTSVGYNYDFEANPRELYAVEAESEV